MVKTQKSSAHRQRAYRQRLKLAGLEEVRGIYAEKPAHQKIKSAVASEFVRAHVVGHDT